MRFLLLVALASLPLSAQWKLPAKQVDLKAPAPKAAGGKPDLSGIWEQTSMTHFRNLMADMKPEERPYLPISSKIVADRADGKQGHLEPDANCLPQGVPKINAAPVPFRIVQTSDLVVLVYEAFNLWRQVHLDGRTPIKDPNPSWLGYSTGRWVDGVLVVETTGLNGRTWLDTAGNPTSEKTKVTEKFRRTSMGTMELEITIDDPTLYSRPWTAKEELRLLTNTEIMEFICVENEKDLAHMNK
jgi:hypothetical protein